MKRLIVTALVFVVTLTFTAITCFAQSASREDLLKELQAKRAALQLLEKQFLAPSSEDRGAYAEFLSQPDTGLIRLLPREAYDSDVYKNTSKSLSIRGGGAYYSFARLTHEYGYGSDLQLEMGHFSVGFAGADYGMLVNLGDVALDEITLEHPRVRYIAAYAPPPQEPNARLEARQFGQGVTVDDVRYGSRLPVEVRSTYLLRSIGYSTSDVLVAFKVVRKDSDGSIILAWKLLRKYPVPELARKDVPELAR
jgi:hypothetical protein